MQLIILYSVARKPRENIRAQSKLPRTFGKWQETQSEHVLDTKHVWNSPNVASLNCGIAHDISMHFISLQITLKNNLTYLWGRNARQQTWHMSTKMLTCSCELHLGSQRKYAVIPTHYR